MSEVSEVSASPFCELPSEVCGVVASFTSPWDWIKQGRISANHYRGVRSHIRRALGVTYREMDEATQVFGAGQSAEVQSEFQQWSDSREMPVILMTDCMFVALGFDDASHKPDYDGRVRVKPVDESYWRSNFGSHSVNPWIMLSEPSENPVRLKNIRDMTEVQFRMDGLKALVPGQSAVIQWFDEDGTDMFIHPIDPITHQLRDKIVHPKPKGWMQHRSLLPCNREGHPQELEWDGGSGYRIRNGVMFHRRPKMSEDETIALDWDGPEMVATDTRSGNEYLRTHMPFAIQQAFFNCDRELISVRESDGLWWIFDLSNGHLTPVSDRGGFKWINQDLFMLFSNELRLRSAIQPRMDIAAAPMNLFPPAMDVGSDHPIPAANLLVWIQRCLVKRNLLKLKDERLLQLDWGAQETRE